MSNMESEPIAPQRLMDFSELGRSNGSVLPKKRRG